MNAQPAELAPVHRGATQLGEDRAASVQDLSGLMSEVENPASIAMEKEASSASPDQVICPVPPSARFARAMLGPAPVIPVLRALAVRHGSRRSVALRHRHVILHRLRDLR